MRARWFPWRQLVSWLARTHGFVDPFDVLYRLRMFAQPSEVAEPIELLRAGMVFHARGLMNTRAIQHNLDWAWPWWVEQQFDPTSSSFLPRAFSVTHVNLTHRNWTAVGLPEIDLLPLVDPRGLVTPHFDGWSLDAWVVPQQGQFLLPTRSGYVRQRMIMGEHLQVETHTRRGAMELNTQVGMTLRDDVPYCELTARARADQPGWLVIALRPANPEGVSFVNRITAKERASTWIIDDKYRVTFDQQPQHTLMSNYQTGDVLNQLPDGPGCERMTCDVGLVSAAAMFPLDREHRGQVQALIPLQYADTAKAAAKVDDSRLTLAPHWSAALSDCCQMQVPDQRMQMLFDAAIHTLILHSPGDVYPGPYTYKRFWFRDAAYILDALLALNLVHRVERAIDRFPRRQTVAGYFRSQEGEWDSNGQVLWIMDRYARHADRQLPSAWLAAAGRGARWIDRKRVDRKQDVPHAGLLPAGFSAEHLGPNDYYYWDDFWGVAGLQAAARMADRAGQSADADTWRDQAASLMSSINRSLERAAARTGHAGMPASPYRRMDAGAIGSIVVGYPLQLWPARDPRLLATAEYLLDNCMVGGGFFQDVIHSGINAYLTLQLAQVLLRAAPTPPPASPDSPDSPDSPNSPDSLAGSTDSTAAGVDPRCFELIEAVADLASPTGQWPEAIHPHTKGGCMGDGQHVWAAAEWVLMMQQCFVQAEDERLILGAGLLPRWLSKQQPLSFGPTLTPFGRIRAEITFPGRTARVRWQAHWYDQLPRQVEIRLPGFEPQAVQPDQHEVVVHPLSTNLSTSPAPRQSPRQPPGHPPPAISPG